MTVADLHLSPPLAAPAVTVLNGSQLRGDVVGGKAAAIDRLIAWSIPVPPTAVVTTTAYRAVCESSSLTALFEQIGRDANVAAAAVDAAFKRAGLPADVAEQVREAALRVSGGRHVAVRSSATVEDMGTSSFAGQYHSVLDVDPADIDALTDAVLSVFASLFHPAPRAYRKALGIGDTGVAMAALIMPMIPAVRAGVVFTQDPTAPPGTARIETVDGLAETLVSGKRTPRVVRVHEGTAPPEGSDEEVAPLLAAAAEIELHAGRPQDVEWAWDGSRLWIVQARPITVAADEHDPFDDPQQELDTQLTTTGIAEMLPGVLPPLRWDICSFVVEEALRTMLDRLGALPDDRMVQPRRLVRRVRGRAALDADMLAAALPDGQRGFAATRHRWLASAARRRASFDAEVAVRAADEIDSGRADLASWTLDELQRYHFSLIDLTTRAMAAEITVAADAGAIHNGLRAVLARFVTDADAYRLAADLTTPAAPIVAPSSASAAIFSGPTWIELGLEPANPVATADRDTIFDNAMAIVTASPRWPSSGVGSWLRNRQIDRLSAEAARQLERRERTKRAILILGGELRRIHTSTGARLAELGRLDRAADIEQLSLLEFRAALCGELGGRLGRPAVTAAQLARRSRWCRQHEEAGPLPQEFRGVPRPTTASAPPGERLVGLAGGGGTFRGIARRVDGPDQTIGADEVLVARTTDPSWAPLLMRCGAMIVEQGGPLSHAAILAREFGVPAVFDVPGAVRALDGKLVRIDADAGVVTIVDEVGEL